MRAGLRLVKSADGELVITYCVFGSDEPDTRIMVFLHGSGLSALSAKDYAPIEVLRACIYESSLHRCPGMAFWTCTSAAELPTGRGLSRY